jgi:hypothetical protein
MNEKSSNELFKKHGFKIIKIWTTQDAKTAKMKNGLIVK